MHSFHYNLQFLLLKIRKINFLPGKILLSEPKFNFLRIAKDSRSKNQKKGQQNGKLSVNDLHRYQAPECKV